MAENKHTELTNRLFDLFDHIWDENLDGEKLAAEIARSKACVEISQQIIANGVLIANACRMAETASRVIKLPSMLTE
jgi:hypothetical protein